jgi:hypothetical protein
MLKILVDTCVWLDIAKDYQQQSTLAILEDLVRQGEVSIILPKIVRDEFNRNRTRVAEEGGRSISGVLKRAKEVVNRLGDKSKKSIVLEQLNEVDYKIPNLGDAVIESFSRIDKLFDNSVIIETTDLAKLLAAQRALEGRAPFHRSKNSVADAILIEMFHHIVTEKNTSGIRFAFVTHNTKDFSHPTDNDKVPHPDLESYFTKLKSRYFINLAEALRSAKPDLVSELMIQNEWEQEPRRLAEIVNSTGELLDKIWYNRHQAYREKVESGEVKLVKKETYPKALPYETCQIDIWEGAKKAARKVEDKYGRKNLGPMDDFEWGMLNGKLSALRWVLGDEWDMLDT